MEVHGMHDGVISAVFGGDPLQLDGMMLCVGCKDRFVLGGYCPDCTRLNLLFEGRRLAAERRAEFVAGIDRQDCGVEEISVADRGGERSSMPSGNGFGIAFAIGAAGTLLFLGLFWGGLVFVRSLSS